MKQPNTLILLAFSCLPVLAFSQSKVVKQIEQTGSDIEKIKNTTDKVRGWLKDLPLGKNRKKDSTGTVRPSNSNRESTQGNNSNTFSTVTKDGLKAGDIAPDARYIECDKIYPFNQGAALILKGSSTALIDAKGDFIVPFNTMSLTPIYDGVNCFMDKGIFLAEWGDRIVDSKGKIIARKARVEPHCVGAIAKFDLYFVNTGSSSNESFTIYTRDGKVYKPGVELTSINENIGVYRIANGKLGYKTISGQTITPAEYSVARPFYEGLAVVGKEDEFRQMKYGYINKQGKLAIPFMFSKEPEGFINGYARIVPRSTTEFEQAFINKSGQIVLKQTYDDIKANGRIYSFNSDGLAFVGWKVIDTTGKAISEWDFLAKYGISKGFFSISNLPAIYFETGKIPFWCEGYQNKFEKGAGVGIVDLKTGKVIPPVFGYTPYSLFFDTVSKLAYAQICIGRSQSGTLLYREGYINEDGLFVIVRKEKSAL